MHLRSLLVAVLVILSASIARAEKGVQCELAVYSQDSSHAGRGVLVYRDTAQFVEGIRTTGFIANFSAEITFDLIDTADATFSVQLVTLGPSTYNVGKRFTAEYRLPARIDQIPGKGNSSYTLQLTPLKPITIDTAGCGWVHYRKDDFKWNPSANVDIYYVPRSLGDYYWNAAKATMEDRYRAFAALNRFTLPGKYLLYLCPCPIPSVIWDTRFGTAVDPTRSTAFVLVNKKTNSVDPYVLIHASILRNYGYAPPFLVEGFAGYMSIAAYDMKQIIKAKQTIPFDTLFIGDRYYHADPRIVDATTSTFVRYLVDQYKADKFFSLYRQANDLNLKSAIESTYGKPMAALELEWRTYVDTLQLKFEQFSFWAGQAEMMVNYPLMQTYRQEALRLARNRSDSLGGAKELARAYFFNGDYAHAAEQQHKVVAVLDTSATEWMALGSYSLMNGSYDSAFTYLSKARALDSTDQLIVFNLALYYSVTGQEKKGTDLLDDYVEPGGANPATAESRVLLGNMQLLTGSHVDEGLARGHFREAYGMLQPFLSGSLIKSSALMWTGILQLGLGDTGSANDYLSMALFLESCPFYEGMDYLWLGKTADLRGERTVAIDYYRKVLSQSSSDYHKKEAQKLLEHPFTR
jgi:tetratricopeptide (TPR) repeat protein